MSERNKAPGRNKGKLSKSSQLALLDEGLDALDLDCGDEEKEQLLDFVALLLKWNRVYNLTSISDPEKVITKHLLDSLTLAPFLQVSEHQHQHQHQHQKDRQIIDVGSGAGLPGLPLAIIYPQYEFVLLDSNSKKTRFIIQAISELRLKNCQVETVAVQDFLPERRFDIVTGRAVTTLAAMVEMTRHLCVKNGHFLLMKGIYPTQELETLPDGVIVRSVDRVDLPGLDAERHIICLQDKALLVSSH